MSESLRMLITTSDWPAARAWLSNFGTVVVAGNTDHDDDPGAIVLRIETTLIDTSTHDQKRYLLGETEAEVVVVSPPWANRREATDDR